MSSSLLVRNCHRAQPINSRLLRSIARALLVELLGIASFDLSIYVVAAPKMAHLNETYLHHQGATDVLAFDYAEATGAGLCGEIYLCAEVARTQAKRFRTSWQSELLRYLVHGVLHLEGYDDHVAARRRQMKREENRLLKALADRFDFSSL